MSLALVCLCLTTGDLHALDALPSHSECQRCYGLAFRYCADLKSWRGNAEALKAQEIGVVLGEAQALCDWWEDVTLATGPFRGWIQTNDGAWFYSDLGGRLQSARMARQVHDWQLYGLPPVWPYWRLPHR